MSVTTRYPPPVTGRWLYAVMAWVIAPHFLHFPHWLSVAVSGLILWRWLVDERARPLPGKWMMLFLMGAAAAGILLQFHTLFGREAGVAFLTLMLSLKLLETRTYRDAMMTVFLGYFIAITQFLFSQSIPIALHAFASVALLVIVQTQLNQHTPMPVRNVLRQALPLTVYAIPLMLLLFVLYPRIPGPLWTLPGDAFGAKSGLSDTMSPGSISHLVLSDAVAFRAKFDGSIPPNRDLYWRAQVLDRFDGRTWYASQQMPPKPEPPSLAAEKPVRYTLTIEPTDQDWVYALETPDRQSLPGTIHMSGDRRLINNTPIGERTRFTLRSYVRSSYPEQSPDEPIARALALPENGNPRTRQLAQQLKAASGSASEIAARALSLFRTGNFVYTLNPPLLGRDGIDMFLFDTRQGFCEHYASAFTFLMRAAGVPARVVAGYQGGEYNPLGQYLVVRQSEAHAWTEIWLQGQGWVRYDPTEAVSSTRIDSGIDAALPDRNATPLFVQVNAHWLNGLRLRWDAFNNGWNQWVLSYDQEGQLGLFSRLGFGIVSWQQLTRWLATGFAVLVGLIALLVFRSTRRATRDPALRLFLKYCERLKKIGFERKPNEGPLDFAKRVISARPELAGDVNGITSRYVSVRYGNRESGQALAEMKQWVKRFRPRRA